MITPPVQPSFAAWQAGRGLPVWAAQPQHAAHRTPVERELLSRLSLGMGLAAEDLEILTAGVSQAAAAIRAWEEAFGAQVMQSFEKAGYRFDR